MGKENWPEWFRREYPGLPETDSAGHQFGPGLISNSMVSCKPCPNTTDGRGHHVVFCRVDGCHAAEIRPPGCSGAYGLTRAELWEQATKGEGTV